MTNSILSNIIWIWNLSIYINRINDQFKMNSNHYENKILMNIIILINNMNRKESK